MKKWMKNISSSTKKKKSKRSGGKDIYSSTEAQEKARKKAPISKSKKEKTVRTPKQIVLLVGKIIACFILVGIISMGVVITGLTVYVMKGSETDSSISLEKEDIMNSGITTVYGTGSDGEPIEIARMTTGTKRMWVDINDVPDQVKNAFVALEDKNFYQHEGVDFFRTFLAFLNMFMHFWSTDQGASTITQQLIKNVTNDRDVGGIEGIRRKIREINRAMSLERSYSKDQILQAYLNIIPIGGKNGDYVGVQTAAKLYFNKDISNVSLAEAASLAAITNAPTYYEPIGHPDHNKQRRDFALDCMFEQGMITQQEHDEAVNTPVQTHQGRVTGNMLGDESNDYQSYFVDAVLNEVVGDYMQSQGISDWNQANQTIISGGYKIYTTIDVDMQQKLEKLYQDPGTFGWNSFGGKPQSAFVVYDQNGQMKACVGATGEKPPGDRSSDNYATQAVRSPGSTMKPLAAYAPAIENNLVTYSSIVEDRPIRQVEGNNWPNNFNKSYAGDVPLYYALEKSLNTVPTRLVEQMGVQSVCDFLSGKLGLTTLVDPAHPEVDQQTGKKYFESSGIAMGSLTHGVRLNEFTNAYQIFGNGGNFTKQHSYTRVIDASDSEILINDPPVIQAISPDTSAVMNRMLRNVITEGTGTAANMDSQGIEVIGKTGTSNDNKNLTFVGLTHDYVAGIWIGELDGSELATSPNPAKIWKTVMSSLLKGVSQSKFVVSSASELTFCNSSGLIATSRCPDQKPGYYRSSNIPNTCNMH